MSSISPVSPTSLSNYLQSQLALARSTALTSASVPAAGTSLFATSGTQSVLATSNTAIFQMANLMAKVRSLTNSASTLRESDKSGLDALRGQVNDALDQFNKISSTASTAVSAASGSTLAASSASTGTVAAAGATTVSLADLQKTLTTMQSNLHGNIAKLGVSIQKALLYSATPTPLAQKYSTTSSLSSLWTKLYGSGSSYL